MKGGAAEAIWSWARGCGLAEGHRCLPYVGRISTPAVLPSQFLGRESREEGKGKREGKRSQSL